LGHHRPSEPSFAYVVHWVTRTPVEDIATSVLVLAGIRHGIELKRRSDREQAKSLDRWYSQMRTRLAGRVLPIDEPVAEAWVVLLGVPNPLPLIDGLLAATAKVRGLTFVTRNVADLAVTGVPLLDPFSGA
jgi:predicted nucleic acid-binding protein